MRLSFQKNIIVIIILSVGILLVIQSYFINRINQTANEQSLAYMDIAADQLEESINTVFTSTSYLTAYLASGSATQLLLRERDPLEFYKLCQHVYDSFRTNVALDRYVDTALITNNRQEIIYTYGAGSYATHTALVQQIFQSSPTLQHPTFCFFSQNNRNYLSCVAAVSAEAPVENQGNIVLFLNLNAVTKALSRLESGPADFLFLDPDGQVISTNAPEVTSEQRDGYTTISRNLCQPGYRMICQINDAMVTEQYSFLRTNSVLIAVVMVLLLMIIGLLFSRVIVMPIQRLISEVTAVGVNSKKKSISGHYGVQLDPLVHNINQMLTNIDDLSLKIFNKQEKLYLQEIMRRESDLYALRNQINPHFIFNTLQTMSGIAILHGERKVAELSTGIAEIFAYALRDGDSVTVENEIDVLEKYLKIMQARRGDHFTWKIDMDKGIKSCVILKMLLQPLVENAVSHGIAKRTERTGGELLLSGRENGEQLIFTVEDNGEISEETIALLTRIFGDENLLYQESKKNRRIGLANIQYRTQLVYGSDCGLSISKGESRTRLTLKIKKQIPIIEKLSP